MYDNNIVFTEKSRLNKHKLEVTSSSEMKIAIHTICNDAQKGGEKLNEVVKGLIHFQKTRSKTKVIISKACLKRHFVHIGYCHFCYF